MNIVYIVIIPCDSENEFNNDVVVFSTFQKVYGYLQELTTAKEMEKLEEVRNDIDEWKVKVGVYEIYRKEVKEPEDDDYDYDKDMVYILFKESECWGFSEVIVLLTYKQATYFLYDKLISRNHYNVDLEMNEFRDFDSDGGVVCVGDYVVYKKHIW